MSAVSAWSNRYDVFMDSDNDEWEPIENVVPKKDHSTKNQKLGNLKAGKPTAKEGEKRERRLSTKNEEAIAQNSSENNSGGVPSQNEANANETSARNAEERNPNMGRRGCFKCDETGHIAKNCPNQNSSNSVRENYVSNMDCYKCGETGHMARNCSSTTDIRSTETNRNIQEPECYNCSNVGHLARNCPSKGGRDTKCYKCEKEGHIARNCPGVNDDFVLNERQENNDYNADSVPEYDGTNSNAVPDVENPSSEAEEVNYTLDEWKSLQGTKQEPKFNIRKPGEGSEIDPKWKKTTVYKKEKESINDEQDDEENEIYLQRAHRQKKVVDIIYNFTDKSRGNMSGRGRGRGGREGRGGRGFSNAGRGGRNTIGQTLDVMDQHSFPSLG